MKTVLLLSLLSQLGDEMYDAREGAEVRLSSFPFSPEQRVFLMGYIAPGYEHATRVQRVFRTWTARHADRLCAAAGFTVWPDVDYSGVPFFFRSDETPSPPKRELWREQITFGSQNPAPFPYHRHGFRVMVSRYLMFNEDETPVSRALSAAKQKDTCDYRFGSLLGVRYFQAVWGRDPYTTVSKPCFDSTLFVR